VATQGAREGSGASGRGRIRQPNSATPQRSYPNAPTMAGTGRRGKQEVREEKEDAGTSRDQRRPGVEAGFDMPFVEQTCNVLPRDNSNGTKAV
jgi:hypothetical protein